MQVSTDPALDPLPASQADTVVGQRAAVDMAAGTLLTRAQVTATVLPAAGMTIVGVGLPAAQMPGEPLLAGDRVRIVATPGDQGEIGDSPPTTIAATVVGVRVNDENGQNVVSRPGPRGRRRRARGARRHRQGGPGAGLPGALSAMALIVLTSASGSPGVTTTALALALTWRRPALLVEADPTGGSAVLAGYFRGRAAPTDSLIDLAFAHRGRDAGGGDPVGHDAHPGLQRHADPRHPRPRPGTLPDLPVGTAG